MINANVFRILTLIALVLMFFAQTATGQVNQYARDGLSFSYPADWPLRDESDATAQTLSLDRGKDEATILILAIRQEMNPPELAEAQIEVTQAIVSALLQEFANAGAQPERSPITEIIAGVDAQGIRLRATVKGQPGNADIYWLSLGGRSVHVVFIGSDQERIRATYAWNMVISTLRVGRAPVSPGHSAAADLRTTYTGKLLERVLKAHGSFCNYTGGALSLSALER